MLMTKLKSEEVIGSLTSGKVFIINCHCCKEVGFPEEEAKALQKKLQEEGKLNVAYGSDEVEVMTSAAVTWEQEDISYCLFTFEESMSAEELLSMAKEVAEQE